uniref:Secreted protein n=1 Tax=Ascaris lumbricoides TaxID=6252 RepID=A0A0M3I736_ASCLU
MPSFTHPTLYIRRLIIRTHQCQAVASTVGLLTFTHNELLLSCCPAANEPRPHRSRLHRVPSSCFAFVIMNVQQAGLLLLLGVIIACVSADAPQTCSQVCV